MKKTIRFIISGLIVMLCLGLADNKPRIGLLVYAAQTAQAKTADISDQLLIDVLNLKDMDIKDVFKLLSEKSNINIIAGNAITGRVTIFLENVKLKDVLRIILDANNLAYTYEDGIVRVMPALDYERKYGSVFGQELCTRIISVDFAEPIDVAAILNQVKSPNGKIIHDPKSRTLVLIDSPDKVGLMAELIKKIDLPIKTEVFELSYADAKDMADKIGGSLLSKSGSISFDSRSHKLIVSDTPQKLVEIAALIKAFDVKLKQVLIEAKIIQVTLSDQTKLGVDWEAIVKKYNGMNLKNSFNILGNNDSGGTMNIGTLETDNYTVLVEALQAEGDTDILSSPRIATLDGKEAKILVGSTEPYVTSTTTTPASGPTTTSETVNFIEVGVKLYVTPQIHKDDFITMKINPEVSSVTRILKTGNDNDIPVVDTSEAETTVTVKDGVTIVIGGLIKDESIDTINKVPLLGDIPLVGMAFRNRDSLKRKTEIVVFLTPHIISGDVPADLPEYLREQESLIK